MPADSFVFCINVGRPADKCSLEAMSCSCVIFRSSFRNELNPGTTSVPLLPFRIRSRVAHRPHQRDVSWRVGNSGDTPQLGNYAAHKSEVRLIPPLVLDGM